MKTSNLLLTLVSNYDPLEVARVVPENDSIWVRVDSVVQLLVRVVTRRSFQLSLDLSFLRVSLQEACDMYFHLVREVLGHPPPPRQ